MGSEKQKGGGVGQQAVGQTQHPCRNCGISAKGGRGKKKFAMFFAEPRAQSQKIIFFCVFFAAKQHVGPGINYFRKKIRIGTVIQMKWGHKSLKSVVVEAGQIPRTTPPSIPQGFSFSQCNQ